MIHRFYHQVWIQCPRQKEFMCEIPSIGFLCSATVKNVALVLRKLNSSFYLFHFFPCLFFSQRKLRDPLVQTIGRSSESLTVCRFYALHIFFFIIPHSRVITMGNEILEFISVLVQWLDSGAEIAKQKGALITEQTRSMPHIFASRQEPFLASPCHSRLRKDDLEFTRCQCHVNFARIVSERKFNLTKSTFSVELLIAF